MDDVIAHLLWMTSGAHELPKAAKERPTTHSNVKTPSCISTMVIELRELQKKNMGKIFFVINLIFYGIQLMYVYMYVLCCKIMK